MEKNLVYRAVYAVRPLKPRSGPAGEINSPDENPRLGPDWAVAPFDAGRRLLGTCIHVSSKLRNTLLLDIALSPGGRLPVFLFVGTALGIVEARNSTLLPDARRLTPADVSTQKRFTCPTP